MDSEVHDDIFGAATQVSLSASARLTIAASEALQRRASLAAERNEPHTWAEHKALLEFGALPLVPVPIVLAQARRSPQQVQLRRLLAKTRTADFVDAIFVGALRKRQQS